MNISQEIAELAKVRTLQAGVNLTAPGKADWIDAVCVQLRRVCSMNIGQEVAQPGKGEKFTVPGK